MRFSSVRIGTTVIFLLAASLLCGCVTANAPDTKFYTLNAVVEGRVPAAAGADQPVSVEVAAIRLPRYLERPQIVTRSSENRLALAEFDQWGGNLKKNMMRALAENLSLLLGSPNVFIAPYGPPAPADFRLELDVMRFEKGPGGKVRLSVQWRLSHGASRQPLITRISDLTSRKTLSSADVEGTVAVMSTLFGELSHIIGREIRARMQQGGNS